MSEAEEKLIALVRAVTGDLILIRQDGWSREAILLYQKDALKMLSDIQTEMLKRPFGGG